MRLLLIVPALLLFSGISVAFEKKAWHLQGRQSENRAIIRAIRKRVGSDVYDVEASELEKENAVLQRKLAFVIPAKWIFEVLALWMGYLLYGFFGFL